MELVQVPLPYGYAIFLIKDTSSKESDITYFYFLPPKLVPFGTPPFLASGTPEIAFRLSYIKDHLNFHGPQIDGWPQDNRTISSNPSDSRTEGPPRQVPGHKTLPIPRGILILEHGIRRLSP